MVMKQNEILRLSQDYDINQAVEVLARAFKNDSLYKYLIPEEEKRHKILPYFFKFRIRYGMLYGETYATSPRMEGLAIWIPYKNINISSWRVLKCGGVSLFLKAGKDVMGRLSNLEEYASQIHKKHADFPHWHLSPIAVDPTFQGKGFARTLLNNMLERIDKEKVPCFLETQSENNVSIYKRYGFKVVEEGKIPNTNIIHWAMMRDAIE